MKFWKQGLLTTIIFLGITTSVVYTACEKDGCVNLRCQNGGVCVSGFCKCQTGYEGSTCQTLSISRYFGKYGGYTTCNGGPNVIDTALVFQGPNVLTVAIVEQSNKYDTLRGTVTDHGSSTYTINIPSDTASIPGDTVGYSSRTVLATVDGKKLNIRIETTGNILYDSSKNVCTFTGFKP